MALCALLDGLLVRTFVPPDAASLAEDVIMSLSARQ
jgi:hypothetical protein